MTERLIAHGDYHHTPDQPCYECGTMPEPASSAPGELDAEIDAMRFAAEKEVDLLAAQLAAKDCTIEQLRKRNEFLEKYVRNLTSDCSDSPNSGQDKVKGEPK